MPKPLKPAKKCVNPFPGDAEWDGLEVAWNAATEAYNKDRNDDTVAALRAARRAFYDARTNLRRVGVALGKRHPQGMVDVVSHLKADGSPDTSYPAGKAYWDEVARAAEAGIPNVVGFQR